MSTSRRAFLGAALGGALAACTSLARDRRGGPRPPPATPPPPAPAPPGTEAAVPTGGTARFVRTGPAGSGAVALTFHGSGDPALTGRLLDAAREAGTPLTIFAVGQWLDANPTMARGILDGGHELANHTYTHPSLGRVGRAGVADEIRRCREALARHGGTPGRWFRPSGIDTPTATMLEEAGAIGYPTVVGFDVDPHDYQDPGGEAVLQRVSAALHPGAIVSLHTGHAGTVAAFGGIVARLRTAGLRAVTVHELLGGPAGPGGRAGPAGPGGRAGPG